MKKSYVFNTLICCSCTALIFRCTLLCMAACC